MIGSNIFIPQLDRDINKVSNASIVIIGTHQLSLSPSKASRHPLLLQSLPKNDYFSNFIFLELLRHIEQKSLFNRTKDVFSTSSIVRAESLSIRSSSCCQLCLVCFDWLKILGKYSRLSVLVTKESMEFGSCQGAAVRPYILWPLN